MRRAWRRQRKTGERRPRAQSVGDTDFGRRRVILDDEDIEAIADRVAAKLRRPVGVGLIDADAVARMIGVKRDWVYANKKRLGAVPIGQGEKPRLRFSLERVRAVMAEGGQPRPDEPAPKRRGRPRKSALPPGVTPIRARPTR
jgi:hypothetical protein